MPQTPELVSQILHRYGSATREGLKRYLPAGSENPHLTRLLADYPTRGGKMMRPSICIATARAFGASFNEALGSAIAIEMMHNAMLIHDDIQDESDVRRGEPTLHVLHGVPLAINAGDGLLLLSLRPLLDNIWSVGTGLALRILQETERMAWAAAEGQAMELGWRQDNATDLTEADYLVMVLKKTSWLGVIYPCRVGALIGRRGNISLEQFVRFGFFLGAAFQIQDDLLNLVADERYGKELNGDIWEGKRTLMLIHCLRHATRHEKDRLCRLLGLPRCKRDAAEIEWVRGLMEIYGSTEYARNVAHALAGAALHEFSQVYGGLPDSVDKAFLAGLSTWVFERT